MATNESFVAHPELCCEGLSIKRLGWRICGYQYCCADRSSRRSGWNADGSCYENLSTGRHRCGWCTTVKKRRDRAWNRSSRLSRRHVLPVAMDHACTTALYLRHLHAAGLRTVSCSTLARLVCCLLLLCCTSTGTRFVGHSTLSPAVITWGCRNDYEALPQGV